MTGAAHRRRLAADVDAGLDQLSAVALAGTPMLLDGRTRACVQHLLRRARASLDGDVVRAAADLGRALAALEPWPDQEQTVELPRPGRHAAPDER